MRALDDITVLDFTQVVAGPVCTQWLATFGAEVIKVEPPDGDAGRTSRNGSYMASFNLGGKKSIGIDLKTDEGREIVKKIARSADVVVENFRPGVLERFDLGYDSITDINSNVVYCSISGFGQEGPYRDRPSLDPIAQAHGGILDITGYPDDPPARIGTSAIDISTGMTGSLLVCAALRKRDRTGEGEYVDISLFDTAISWMAYWISEYVSTGETPTREGDGLGDETPYGIYSAGSDLIYLIAYDDRRFERLCPAIGREDLLEDSRFTSEEERIQNASSLRKELEDTFCQYETDRLVETITTAGVPAGPVQNVADIVEDDPQIEALDMLTDTYNFYQDTRSKTAKPAFRTRDGSPDVGNRPPILGEHSREVLADYGYTDDEVDQLIEDGTIVEMPNEI